MFEKSVELLNRGVGDEMQAVHQYMYFHFHCDDQGYDPLAALFRQIAIEEMMHVERLAERILFLKGEVEMVPSGPVEKLHDVRQMLEQSKAMEMGAIKAYNEMANQCSAEADSGSKQIFEALVADEEGHFDQFETLEDNVERFGEQFLALQSMERSRNLASGASGAE